MVSSFLFVKVIMKALMHIFLEGGDLYIAKSDFLRFLRQKENPRCRLTPEVV